MFRKDKPLALKSSASMICNNLTVLNSADKGFMNYAVIHKYLINMVCTSTDGSQVTHKQVTYKGPSVTQQVTSMIMQTKWVTLGNGRSLLVLTSLRGIQIFEYDGSAMVYWHSLSDGSAEDTDNTNFGRGIAAVGDSLLCVGTKNGPILIFEVPAKGTSVSVINTLQGHTVAISELAGQGSTLVSGDEDGNVIFWQVQGADVQQTCKNPGNGNSCSSLALWKDVLAVSFGNGQIGVYSAVTGKEGAMVNAHARWINALDVAKDSGLLLSVSEDSYARVWQLVSGPVPSIEFKFAESVTDQQLVGGRFIHSSGRGFCTTGYDSSDITFYLPA